jgi:hypothetical protein
MALVGRINLSLPRSLYEPEKSGTSSEASAEMMLKTDICHFQASKKLRRNKNIY